MMMINISFHTLVLMILVSILTVTQETEPDNPCPNEHEAIVADMCTDDSAVEDNANGGNAVDSVLLRITKQQNNCICHVSLQNTVSNYTVYMSKYEEQTNAAPGDQNCGLAVDVAYLDTSGTIRSLQPINCTKGTSKRPITLGGNELQLRSSTTADDFTTGYCMQILRNTCNMASQKNKSGSDDWFEAKKKTSTQECEDYCLETEACVAVSYGDEHCFLYNQTTVQIISKDNSTYSQKICADNQRLQIRCYDPESSTLTSQVTTTEDNHSTQIETVTSPTSDHPVTNSNTKSTTQIKNEDENFDLYVYIGATAGGVLMLLLIVFIIVCIRKKSNQTSLKESKKYPTTQICSETRDSDSDYGGLKDNVLYVSSEPEPNEILEDGNYNTVDLEQTRKVKQDNNLDGNYSTVDGICTNSSLSKSKPVVKPKPKTNSSLKRGADEETIHLSTMDNSNNEYAVVDKGRNSDAVKHINPEHGNDTEYAVVNKVKRSSNNN